MNIDDAIKIYSNDLKSNQGRHESIKAKAEAEHNDAVSKADRAHRIALRKAAEAYETAVQETTLHTAQAAAAAERKFDEAARAALGAPRTARVTTVNAQRYELYLADERTPAASATNTGPAGWHVDGPEGRQFCGSNPIGARVALWHAAVALGLSAAR